MSFPPPPDAKHSKIWIDGCFDFAHHGHAGAMLQARKVGNSLHVGVHSDEEILQNKGPTVMNLGERMTAVTGCKWCTVAVPDAPYVTDPQFMDKFQCKYAVHGDDITTDASGEDCYKIVKDLGRFIVVKRTPSISTTDLVGRMLLATKSHHMHSFDIIKSKISVYESYASDSTGNNKGTSVYIFDGKLECFVEGKSVSFVSSAAASSATTLPKSIVYVSGAFDLFHPGHIELLHQIKSHHPSSIVVVGLINDTETNTHKGLNYPIMTLLERSLCVISCKYVDSVILGAPLTGSSDYYNQLFATYGTENISVIKGPTTESGELEFENKKGWVKNADSHMYDDMTTETIVKRVLDNRAAYEERQRKKGWKAEKEKEMEKIEKNSS